MTLLVENKGQSTQKVSIGVHTPDLDYNGFFIFLERMVANNQLFAFRTNALFTQTSTLIQALRSQNTTKHAIEVTGSVSAKVYDARVMRIGQQ